jgi:3-oxoadipate enol-lactonase
VITTPSGARLWAERTGAGAPIVLLHGAGMDSRLWDGVVPGLAAAGHSVIRYDAAGLGRSGPVSAPFWDVDDLSAVLDHFQVERAALAGMSMGGETALDFALAYPGRVTALVLVGASVSGYQWPASPEQFAYSAARRDRDAARLAELELSIWASMGTAAPGGDLIEAMVAENAQRRVDCEHLARYPEADAISRLGQLTMPALVLHGDRDHPEIAVIADRLIAGLPCARGEMIRDADHYLPLRTPDRLTELITQHLTR